MPRNKQAIRKPSGIQSMRKSGASKLLDKTKDKAETKTKSKKVSETVRCKCVTLKGSQCSRTGKYDGFCFQHKDCKKVIQKSKREYIIPTEKHGLRDPNQGQLIADGYNLNFSINRENVIKVSTPDGTSNIEPNSNHLDDKFIKKLKKMGWTDKAIKKLEKILINPSKWKNLHKNKYINDKTGELSETYWD
jgi:hypothetical protein